MLSAKQLQENALAIMQAAGKGLAASVSPDGKIRVKGLDRHRKLVYWDVYEPSEIEAVFGVAIPHIEQETTDEA